MRPPGGGPLGRHATPLPPAASTRAERIPRPGSRSAIAGSTDWWFDLGIDCWLDLGNDRSLDLGIDHWFDLGIEGRLSKTDFFQKECEIGYGAFSVINFSDTDDGRLSGRPG